MQLQPALLEVAQVDRQSGVLTGGGFAADDYHAPERAERAQGRIYRVRASDHVDRGVDAPAVAQRTRLFGNVAATRVYRLLGAPFFRELELVVANIRREYTRATQPRHLYHVYADASACADDE